MIQTRRPPEVDRAAASRRAVAARRERAALKKDVAMRVLSAQELLRRAQEHPDTPAGAMRVTEFLTALPAIGEGKRDRILAELGIAPVKRLGGLGPRQRDQDDRPACGGAERRGGHVDHARTARPPRTRVHFRR